MKIKNESQIFTIFFSLININTIIVDSVVENFQLVIQVFNTHSNFLICSFLLKNDFYKICS